MERLLWIKQPKNDPVHKKIMQRKDTFLYNDDFDEEAIQAAVNNRKYLIGKLLKDYSFNVDECSG